MRDAHQRRAGRHRPPVGHPRHERRGQEVRRSRLVEEHIRGRASRAGAGLLPDLGHRRLTVPPVRGEFLVRRTAIREVAPDFVRGILPVPIAELKQPSLGSMEDHVRGRRNIAPPPKRNAKPHAGTARLSPDVNKTVPGTESCGNPPAEMNENTHFRCSNDLPTTPTPFIIPLLA